MTIKPKPDLTKYPGEIIEHVLPVGSYVLGTKYTDGDPGDAWGVGYYLESFRLTADGPQRHRIIGNDGVYLYGPKGFVTIRSGLTSEVGQWLVDNCQVLERSPPGTINLWGMLTDLAFGETWRDTGGNDASRPGKDEAANG